MTTITNEKKKILDFVYGFSEIAKKESWVPRYDAESDSLSVTVSKLSSDARIKYFDDEVAFYISKNGIEGIFVEYFRSNFLQHHKGFEDLLRVIKERKNNNNDLIELNREMDQIIPTMGEIIKSSLAEKIVFNPIG